MRCEDCCVIVGFASFKFLSGSSNIAGVLTWKECMRAHIC